MITEGFTKDDAGQTVRKAVMFKAESEKGGSLSVASSTSFYVRKGYSDSHILGRSVLNDDKTRAKSFNCIDSSDRRKFNSKLRSSLISEDSIVEENLFFDSDSCDSESNEKSSDGSDYSDDIEVIFTI